jgi:hypothetical protein
VVHRGDVPRVVGGPREAPTPHGYHHHHLRLRYIVLSPLAAIMVHRDRAVSRISRICRFSVIRRVSRVSRITRTSRFSRVSRLVGLGGSAVVFK